MQQFFLAFLKTHWPIFFLVSIGFLVCLLNYTPGTILSGWDTLHPEFNVSLAFSRAFFGVFRPEQGLGAVAAHSHMADLPHILISSILYAISTMQMVRYLFIFLCYLVGPLGMYIFLRHLIPQKTACFIGSLFYMLNIGTVQNFYVPFEMFVVQYAALPWLFFFATDFLLTNKKSSLAGFVVTVILSSPMAFAATLWYMTFFVLGVYILTVSFLTQSRGDRRDFFQGRKSVNASALPSSEHWKKLRVAGPRNYKALLLLSIMLFLNLYWILPNSYFVLVHGKDVTNALTNQLFSEEAFLYNKAFGNFSSIALLKTFYLAWSAYGNNRFVQLMQPWIDYLSNPLIGTLSILLFGFALLGIVASITRGRKIFISLLPCAGLCILFLINGNLPLHTYTLLEKIPLFQESFRFPDDKILGIYVFFYTIFFAYGTYTVTSFLKKSTLHTTYYLLLTTLIIAVSFPIFTGNLISPAMRIRIPQSYFNLFQYLSTQPQGRIATLPIPYLWGWEYYQWDNKTPSFQGSGFVSFGIPQATMDRDFDRWNPDNETYYREMSHAVYTQNQRLFANTLKKYQITSVLVDTSIIVPFEKKHALFYPQIHQLLADLHLQSKQFGTHLFLYTLPKQPQIVAFTHALPTSPPVVSDFVDTTFAEKGDYVTESDAATNNTGPLAVDHLDILSPNDPLLTTALSPAAAYHIVQAPFLSIASQNLQNDCAFTPFTPSLQTQSLWQKDIAFGFVRYTSSQGSLCDHINFPYPLAHHPYLLQITARNLAGLSLRICVSDPATGSCIIYTKLPATKTFITRTLYIPSFAQNKRFSVNIDTIGVSGTTSINDVQNIQVLQLPQENITPTSSAQQPIYLPFMSFAHQTGFSFTAPQQSATIALWEAYDPGWQMYKIVNSQSSIVNGLSSLFPFFFGQPVGHHVKIDNWANGWVLPNSQSSIVNNQYIIVFLPQYLEYLGFVIGGITLGILSLYFQSHIRKSYPKQELPSLHNEACCLLDKLL